MLPVDSIMTPNVRRYYDFIRMTPIAFVIAAETDADNTHKPGLTFISRVFTEQLWQLRDIGRNPPRCINRDPLRLSCVSSARSACRESVGRILVERATTVGHCSRLVRQSESFGF
jgi:hypothetical protein